MHNVDELLIYVACSVLFCWTTLRAPQKEIHRSYRFYVGDEPFGSSHETQSEIQRKGIRRRITFGKLSISSTFGHAVAFIIAHGKMFNCFF